MKRIVPVVLAALLALATARVPAATAAASALSSQQTEELVGSYVRLTADFYKKVDRQAVLDGARTSMIEYLKKHNVANASLPPLHATADDNSNAEALYREVSTAVTEYASKLTPVESISPSSQITYAAIAGVLASVKDRYTTFLTPKEYAALNEGLDGTSFGGVGISYSPDEKTQTLHVENIIPDGPSDKAGLQPEDAITAVDGKSVAELLAPAMTEKDDQKRLGAEQKIISGVLRGTPGTRVRLTIQRNGKLLEPVTLTRETIHAPSVTSKMLPGQIGYVDLSVFGQSTATELTAALKRLDCTRREGVRPRPAQQRRRLSQRRDRRVVEVHLHRPDRQRAVARRRRHRVRRRQQRDRAAPAGRAREPLHRIGIGDHRRCDSRQRRRHARRREDVRQRRRAVDLPDAATAQP